MAIVILGGLVTSTALNLLAALPFFACRGRSGVPFLAECSQHFAGLPRLRSADCIDPHAARERRCPGQLARKLLLRTGVARGRPVHLAAPWAGASHAIVRLIGEATG